jgi:hypothetical protein
MVFDVLGVSATDKIDRDFFDWAKAKDLEALKWSRRTAWVSTTRPK